MSKLLSEYLNEFASAHGLRMANAGLPSGYDTIMGFAELAIKMQTENAELTRLYNELIMEVVNKIDGETRHETALRCIREYERRDSGPAQSV